MVHQKLNLLSVCAILVVLATYVLALKPPTKPHVKDEEGNIPKSKVTVKVDTPINFTCMAGAGGGLPTSWLWFKGTKNITNATNATYHKEKAAQVDVGSYSCKAVNANGTSPPSDAFNLAVEIKNGLCEKSGSPCKCIKGYGGTDCETEINYCSPDPCKNGALCLSGLGYYICNCKEDFKGVDCTVEKIHDPCNPNPCWHGTKCKKLTKKTFECECGEWWRGDKCQKHDVALVVLISTCIVVFLCINCALCMLCRSYKRKHGLK